MDVIGFGLANIDLVARVDEGFLARHGLPKGGEKTMGDLEFARMRAELPAFDALPGGCVANTLCGLSAMGIDTRCYSKIGHDGFESLYRTGFRDYGVAYQVAPSSQESAQCLVLITPDGERSFTQTRGASFDLSIDDVDWSECAQAQILYAEIYACDFGGNTDFFEKLCSVAKAHTIPLFIKIVDTDYGKRFAGLLREQAQRGAIALIVGNHDNLPSIIGGGAALKIRSDFMSWPCPVLMTAAGKGGIYFENGTAHDFTVEAIVAPANSSGAGDQFMAGFIAAKLDHRPIEDCLAFGARTARAILMHNQPRPPLSNRQSIRF